MPCSEPEQATGKSGGPRSCRACERYPTPASPAAWRQEPSFASTGVPSKLACWGIVRRTDRLFLGAAASRVSIFLRLARCFGA